MLITNGILPVPTTSKNPQANSIVERMHKTVGDVLRTHLRDVEIENEHQATAIIDSALASAQCAMRATANSTF